MEVYPVVFSNDVTALKPLIQYDEDRNANVGLEMHDLTYNKSKSEPVLEREVLLKKIVCEVVVSSVTSLDNPVCLPVAVHYASKIWISGDNIKCTYTEQISQICKKCISKTNDINLILQKDKYLVCKSYCTDCFNGETVRESFSIRGQTETNTCLRACDYCLQGNFCCIRELFW